MFTYVKEKISIHILNNRINKNYLKLALFILIISFFLSGIVSAFTIICFPNYELAELENQNKLLSSQLEQLDKKLIMIHEKTQIREQMLISTISGRSNKITSGLSD